MHLVIFQLSHRCNSLDSVGDITRWRSHQIAREKSLVGHMGKVVQKQGAGRSMTEKGLLATSDMNAKTKECI